MKLNFESGRTLKVADVVKGKEMCGACSTYGRQENAYWVSVGKPEGKRPLEKLGVSGGIILKCILRSGMGCVAWTDLAQIWRGVGL